MKAVSLRNLFSLLSAFLVLSAFLLVSIMSVLRAFPAYARSGAEAPSKSTAKAVSSTDSSNVLSVSVNELKLEKDERVVEFKLFFNGAALTSLPRVPRCWSLTIHNFVNEQSGWNTTIDGAISVGTASLYADFFRNCAQVEITNQRFFDAKLEATATKDFQSYRKIIIPKEGITFTPLGSFKP